METTQRQHVDDLHPGNDPFLFGDHLNNVLHSARGDREMMVGHIGDEPDRFLLWKPTFFTIPEDSIVGLPTFGGFGVIAEDMDGPHIKLWGYLLTSGMKTNGLGSCFNLEIPKDRMAFVGFFHVQQIGGLWDRSE